MQIEMYPLEDKSGDWVVELVNLPGEGEINTVIFSGSDAERGAREYSDWKGSKEKSKAA
jgi:hypothetical protein